MGSCVSVHKESDSAVKLGFSVGSKNDKLLIPSPPVKQVSDTVNGGDRTLADLALKSHWSPSSSPLRDAGSKDDAFFDSQPWLESDCEDDFLSVNGDFTPSRGNTPVHHKFSSANPPPNKTELSPPPSDKKKKLSELFKESLRNHNYEDEQKSPEATSLVPPKSASGTPSRFGASNGVLGQGDDDSVRAGQCCLPRLRSSRSLNEKKKKLSPAHSEG